MSGYTADVQVLLRAMQKYGIILADNGSAWFVSGAPDDRWNNNNLSQFRQLRGTDFEAVDESSFMGDPNSAAVNSAGFVGSLDTANCNTISGWAADKSRLNQAINVSLVTGAQTVALTFAGATGVSWTAASNQSNIQVSPTSGTGNALLQITATSGPNGVVTITAPTATNSPRQIQINVASAAIGNP